MLKLIIYFIAFISFSSPLAAMDWRTQAERLLNGVQIPHDQHNSLLSIAVSDYSTFESYPGQLDTTNRGELETAKNRNFDTYFLTVIENEIEKTEAKNRQQCEDDFALITRLLQCKKINPNGSNLEKLRPLAHARSVRMIRLLLDHGANPELCNNSLFELFAHYSLHKIHYKDPAIDDNEWLSREISCMNLLINETNANYYWNKTHPLAAIIQAQVISDHEKQILLKFFIQHESNPTNSYRSDSQLTVMQYTQKYYPTWHTIISNLYSDLIVELLEADAQEWYQ